MLDVTGVREVWPNANVEALQREFAGIRDQNLEFEGCRISSVGTAASASCAGVLETGFRAGGRRPRVERRHWQFTLRKSGEAWRITQVADATKLTLTRLHGHSGFLAVECYCVYYFY